MEEYVSTNPGLERRVDVTNLKRAEGHKLQEEWINFFNEQGERMMSAMDLYQAGKTASDEVLFMLRDDFYRFLVTSSTSIIYNPNNLSARIIQNFCSTVIEPTSIDATAIVYDFIGLKEVLNRKIGINYLQALFNTKDDSKTITKVLENLSKKNVDNIELCTLPLHLRDVYPIRAVGFGGGGDTFRIMAGYFFWGCSNVKGCSYGVSPIPNSKGAKK